MHPFLNTAVTAARKAGRVITRGYERFDKVQVSQKAQNDYVTNIDQESESVIIETLSQAYPDHAFIGEETGVSGESEFTWVIDPLDGTTNFVHHYPHFAISIALLVNGRAEHGLIYDPIRDDLFTASRGSGAFLNANRIRVKQSKTLPQSLLGLCFTKRFLPKRIEAILHDMQEQAGGIRRSGSSALDLAYVAAGRLDATYQFGMKPWDIAAGMLMVHEAGGTVIEPHDKDPYHTGHIIGGNLKLIPLLDQIVKSHDNGQ